MLSKGGRTIHEHYNFKIKLGLITHVVSIVS